MDVQRTMEFILEQQAKMAVDQARLQEQQAKMQERQAKFEEESRKNRQEIDRRFKAVGKLLTRGAKALDELTAAQKRSDAKLDRLIEAMRGRSPNGRR